jgi:ATP-dependent Clp protease ATP-binding subunit ClpA
MKMGGRYSQHARRAMMQARLFAREKEHSILDTSHLLVGILRAEGSLGYRVLQDLNMDLTTAELRTATLHKQHHEPSDTVMMSQALRTTLTFAVEESQALGHHYIGTEHLLLGLARGGGGAAQPLLHTYAISLDQLRRQVRRVLQAGETEIGLERDKRMARLSELSRRVLNRALLIAEEMEQPDVDLMHLVLALADERRSPSGRVLRQCGLDAERLRIATADLRPSNSEALEEVLDEAVLSAERLGSHYTGTDHIVLTLAHDRRGGRLLGQYGVDLLQLMEEMENLMRRER